MNHAETYVDGTVHTQGIEQAFRFNTRKASDSERFDDAVSGAPGKRLTYKHLTGVPAPS